MDVLWAVFVSVWQPVLRPWGVRPSLFLRPECRSTDQGPRTRGRTRHEELETEDVHYMNPERIGGGTMTGGSRPEDYFVMIIFAVLLSVMVPPGSIPANGV